MYRVKNSSNESAKFHLHFVDRSYGTNAYIKSARERIQLASNPLPVSLKIRSLLARRETRDHSSFVPRNKRRSIEIYIRGSSHNLFVIDPNQPREREREREESDGLNEADRSPISRVKNKTFSLPSIPPSLFFRRLSSFMGNHE